MRPRLSLPRVWLPISRKRQILRERLSRRELPLPNSRRSPLSQAQISSYQGKHEFSVAKDLRAVGTFEGLVDSPFGCPANSHGHNNFEPFVFVRGLHRSTLRKRLGRGFRRIHEDPAGSAFSNFFGFIVIGEIQLPASRRNP